MAPKLFADHRDGMHASRLAILYLPIEALKPDPKNARQHSKKQIAQIARSIATFGCNVPLVVDAQGNIIAGHGRLEAAKRLGLSELPTIAIEHLTPEQAKAFAIADNRLTEIATWDDRLLGETLGELSALDLDFSLDVTGFEIPQIELLIEGVAPQLDEVDALPTAQPGPAVCRPGDLWRLGPHRIYCGSAIEESAYQTLMGEIRAAAVFTDPPCSVPIKGHASGLGAIQHREFGVVSGELDESSFTAFLGRACTLLARYSRNGSLHYICIDWGHIRELLHASQPAYSELKNLCVSVKDNAGMGALYRSQHELVFVFKNGRGRRRNSIGKYGRDRSDVWNYPGARSCTSLRLVADALLDSTSRGEIILDPFLGSGTTLIAAERVGRRCHGLEIDPLCVDTAIRRWQADTGKTAHHAETGRSFDEINRTFGDRK